jgi:hypothetical protein
MVVMIVTISLLLLYLVHKVCLWLEQKGLLYYWHKKPEGGILGNALQELQCFLNPSSCHVVEVKHHKLNLVQSSDNDKK